MHILAEQIRSLDDSVAAVDLGQSPAEVVVLSFSDSDLGLVAAVQDRQGPTAPSLRLASLAALRHPYSVDLYLEKVATQARFVLVRLLGGADYWRYGVDQLAMAARARGFDLAFLPGDGRPDQRLLAASTLPSGDIERLGRWFAEGGPDNIAAALAFIGWRLGRNTEWTEPMAQPAFGCFEDACRCGGACRRRHAPAGKRALVVGYRALVNAGDSAPITAVTEALTAAGYTVLPVWVTSLKDAAAMPALTAALAAFRPDVIVNTTAFSARLADGSTVLDGADAPVIQAPLATISRDVWAASTRGLAATDLAMSVVLPEVDGRIDGPVISFKAPADRHDGLQYTPIRHRPDDDGIARLVELADGWTQLRRTPRPQRRIALVLSNYAGKGGRTAHAVGLDGPASLVAIADDLRSAGYGVGALPDAAPLIASLENGTATLDIALGDYRRWFARLPPPLQTAMISTWGAAEGDPAVTGDSFRLAAVTAGQLLIAVQPDRGRADSRAADHHAPNLAPRHAYAAFYLWLRHGFDAHAMIHLGTHGTLEWLPGKATGLSGACAPVALVGGLPVIYPFIVNNPGEAAQAKRRISAVTVGHLTPPLSRAGAHGDIADIELLVDEFASAQALDPRRAKHLAAILIDKAETAGIAEAAGLSGDLDLSDKLARLDAWICDVKDMRIADGLHVFGRTPDAARVAAHFSALGDDRGDAADAFVASGGAERDGLLSALDGRRLAAGPAGAPGPKRLDVLPTGRNLYAIDPRGVPTRTAMEIGARTAEEVVARYVEEHGDWPKRIVLDVWASASMRTGGDDIAQALALLGVRPTWDSATGRVSGFTVLAPARLGRPRVDVTLRVSGLFRDVFPAQISLFDAVVQTVAGLDEDAETNPLAGLDEPAPARIYGAAPGAFGAGIGDTADDDTAGRDILAAAYLAASSHAYGAASDGPDSAGFAARVRSADAFVHVQDLDGQDLLSNDAFPAHEGGFAAAAHQLGGPAALYHVDTTGSAPKVRTLKEEIDRVVHGRAANPRWIDGQMRHGHRGAAEICEAICNLTAFATLSDAVSPRAFDRLFDATFGDDNVRDFLLATNPAAARDALARLNAAIARGAWTIRRNSVAARLADTEARLT